MPRTCIFCPNPANSKEDLFSKWILRDLKSTSAVKQAMKATIGKHLSVWLAKPEVKVGTVCGKCNNVWMSGLETENKPTIHAMINDEAYWLTEEQQTSLSRWAVMKAMVLDSMNTQRTPFYLPAERIEVKNNSLAIPLGTNVWLGRLSVNAFHMGGTDLWGDINKVSKAFNGCVTTIIMGHMIIQILSGHALTELATDKLFVGCKPGKWDTNLLDIWPTSVSRRWPPSLSLDLRGADSIGHLLDRWKLGTDLG